MTRQLENRSVKAPATHEDAARCYRLFLGREAENDHVVQARVGADWSELVIGFLDSPEFGERLVSPLLEEGRPHWEPPTFRADPVLGAWVSRRFTRVDKTASDPLLALALQHVSASAEGASAALWRHLASRLAFISPPLPVIAPAARRLAGRALQRAGSLKAAAAAIEALNELDKLSLEAGEEDAALLAPADAFDAALYLNSPDQAEPREEQIARYLRGARWRDFRLPLQPGESLRRALPGFHPQIYAAEANGDPAASGHDPLTHYLKAGRPHGRWRHEVIQLRDQSGQPHATALRVALHGHFHHVESARDLVTALTPNASQMDLLLTTTSEEAACSLRTVAAAWHRGSAEVIITPNHGRNLAPLIRVLQDRVLGRYDLVGHVHGKRSAHARIDGLAVGETWRRSLWRSLLGPEQPVADIILRRFEQALDLGLVFPETETLMGWTQNGDAARMLGARLGVARLPDHIEFPMGAMFWARSEALRPLVEAGLQECDFPPEPVPEDGTSLHALERLLPLMVEANGRRYATTYDPDATRWR